MNELEKTTTRELIYLQIKIEAELKRREVSEAEQEKIRAAFKTAEMILNALEMLRKN